MIVNSIILPSLLSALTISPVPADPRPHTIIQSNGKTLTYFLKGDERIHWFETLDGYTIMQNEDGEFEFACIDECDRLQCSGILACNIEERDEIELSFLETIPKGIFFKKKINSKH